MTYTPTSWAEDLLADVNNDDPSAPPVPIDANTVSDILHWMPLEEPTSDWYDRNNPLNASLGTSASDGTGSYPDLVTGANETALMIDQKNMSSIRTSLVDDDAPAAFSEGVVTAPWASSHYGVAAAGAPAKYVVAGRGLDYLSTTSPGGGNAPAGSGVPGSTPTTVDAAQLASLNLNPTDLFGIPGTIAGDAAGALWGEIGPFIAKAILVIAGLGIMVLGLNKLADSQIPKVIKGAGPEIAEAA